MASDYLSIVCQETNVTARVLLLQLSSDFHDTLKILLSPPDVDHILLGSWLDPFCQSVPFSMSAFC